MTSNDTELQSWWREACPLFEQIGLEIHSTENGIYRCAVPLSVGNSNHFNTMHAAVQVAVSEVLGGVIAMSIFSPDDRSKVFGAVSSLSVDFLRPARSAVVAEAIFEDDRSAAIRATVLDGGNAKFDLQSKVYVESGEVVARSVASYVVRPWRDGSTNITQS